MRFVPRLPENFSACSRLIGKGGPLKNIGHLSHRTVWGKDICACYRIHARISEDTEATLRLREKAGCFVLLTSVPEHEISGIEILRTYKEQDGIEKNFGFLKDPLIVNDVFLKKPHRIEAMGLVLVLSLLLWRLMERNMRKTLREKRCTLKGWNNSDTSRPTSL